MMLLVFIILLFVIFVLFSIIVKDKNIGKTVYWLEVEEIDSNSWKAICKSGTIISGDDKICVQLENKELVFLDKNKLFLEKWKLKKSIGAPLTPAELLDSYRINHDW